MSALIDNNYVQGFLEESLAFKDEECGLYEEQAPGGLCFIAQGQFQFSLHKYFLGALPLGNCKECCPFPHVTQ